MPDANGKLSEDERKRIADWLNAKGKNHVCPVCQTNNWTVGGVLLNAMTFTPGAALSVGGATFPMAFITCVNCNYNRTFMALPILGEAALRPPSRGPDGKQEN